MKKLLSLVVSLVILAVIYWKIDFAKLIEAFRNADPLWLVGSLAMVIPLTLFTSWRLQQLMPKRGQLGFGEANRLILVASVLNMVLPSKGGDIAKAYFMKDKGGISGSLALSIVVFEKACDMLSLLLWCVFGLCLYPQKDLLFWTMTAGVAGCLTMGVLMLGSLSFANFFFGLAVKFAPGKIGGKFANLRDSWAEMHGYFWASKVQLTKITLTSVFIWLMHLLQIWMFVLALKQTVPFLTNLALAPLSILAGLLPLTFAGVGTRDAALIYFYGPYIPAGAAAALGVLCTARYLLPALGGLPFVSQYIGMAKKTKPSEQPVEAGTR